MQWLHNWLLWADKTSYRLEGRKVDGEKSSENFITLEARGLVQNKDVIGNEGEPENTE